MLGNIVVLVDVRFQKKFFWSAQHVDVWSLVIILLLDLWGLLVESSNRKGVLSLSLIFVLSGDSRISVVDVNYHNCTYLSIPGWLPTLSGRRCGKNAQVVAER